AGTLPLAPIRYSYFDPDVGRYLLAEAPAVNLVVAPRGTTAASRAEPPPIRLDQRPPIATRLRQLLPDVAWLVLALLPMLALLAPRLRPRRTRAIVAAPIGTEPLSQAERRLDAALRRLGAGEDWSSQDRLGTLLHQAGIPREQAQEIAAVRDRLRQARFGGEGSIGMATLVPDVDRLLAVLGEGNRNGGRRWLRRAGFAGICLLAMAGVESAAQAPPEQLYEAGAYRAAADGFQRRAQAAPAVTAHWFNLGAASWRAGDDAVALAAWTEAARLSPRDHGVRRALGLVPAADGAAAADLWVAPINPDELSLLGFVIWLSGAIGALTARGLRGRWIVLLAGGALFLTAGAGLAAWYRRPIAITTGNETLRLSPHERAPGVGEVARLSTVRVGPARGGWVRVDVPGGERGWIQAGELIAVGHEASH
ncbi:MAG: hypothetical protein ABI587_14880, partial [Gemmatimonadales bacterium]